MVKPVVLEGSDSDVEFDRAFTRLTQLVDLQQADRLHPVRSNAVYTSSVVLWMLVYQRMNPDGSLEVAVKKLIRSRPDCLPDNKRVTDGTLSSNTTRDLAAPLLGQPSALVYCSSRMTTGNSVRK